MTLIDIEKNDVDISQLFAYKSSITLDVPDSDLELTFYQRVVGDEYANKAKVYALRKSGEFRENLRNPKWSDRVAYLPSFRKMKKAQIIDHILAFGLQDLMSKVGEDVQVPFPKDLEGNSTLEDQEEYQKKLDKYPEKVSLEITKGVEKELKVLRLKYNKILKDDLINIYEEAIIGAQTSEEFSKAYHDMTTYYGTFIDEEYNTLAFRSLADFINTPTQLKRQLVSNYITMELKGGTLKKSQGVTP